ncbi:MAG: EAL domain-containing protein [Bacillota bacterium]|nr:EAL domain-containing protein [Bacillota bacterium]
MGFKWEGLSHRVTPMRIALFYALIGEVWILLSDHLLGFIVTDHQLYLRLEMAKGWLFIAATALFLYFLFQREYNTLRRYEKELQKDRENLERYRLLSEDTLDLILFIRPDGQIIDANEAAVKRYGYTRQELTNMPLYKLCLPEDKLSVQQYLKKAPQGIQLESRHIAKDGSAFPVDICAKGATSNGKPIIVSIIRDISKRKKAEELLTHQAQHDALTGLPNRYFFNESLCQALTQSRNKNGKLAVMFLDLDRFKLINDTMGHNLGDQLLKKVAERVGQNLRAGDTLARLGGDEFLILLPDIRNDQEVVFVSERILKVLTQPIIIEGNEVYMTTSIGISLYPNDGSDMETLVKQADTAMYFAKEKGRNNYQFFNHELNIKANERLTTEYSLRKALAREEFVLHYQPQVDLESGCIVGLEALVRWQSKERGIVPPTAFIPIAEETGLIVPIGEWVLRAACIQNVAWQLQGYPPMRMSVNISARQFREVNFIKVVSGILEETGMDAHLLELEITESVAMENGAASTEKLSRFKELGIRISIDDFGTGFSSLNYLRRMPIDTLKIDQSFIRDISSDQNGEEVVTAIIQLAKNLRLKVIAEGVETNTQWSFLKNQKCDEMQGFLFSKAVTSEEAEMLFEGPII